MSAGFQVRRADWRDAANACRIVRRSILNACTADHGGDPQRIADWLRNKTPVQFARWILASDAEAWLAEQEGRGLGFALRAGAELRLCYVAPEALRQGVGRALLRQVAAGARAEGLPTLQLHSTLSALPFYERMGLQRSGPSRSVAGIATQPMHLPLRKPAADAGGLTSRAARPAR